MKIRKRKINIGIIGCGAIGSRLAKAIDRDMQDDCRLTGLFDTDSKKISALLKSLKTKKISTSSLDKVIKDSDCVIEAVNTNATADIVMKTIEAKKSALVMSVGRLLKIPEVFTLARKNKCVILLPSGAIAGIDAIKAACLVPVKSITLTTRKPPTGFIDNDYLRSRGIEPLKITKETTIFEGNVHEAVKHFSQNINVAATIAIASGHPDKLKIKLIASPKAKRNSHEIELMGDSGRIFTRTENTICPDNPKTSYLAALSGLQSLKQYCTGILIGT